LIGAVLVVPLAVVLAALVEVPTVTPFAWDKVSAEEPAAAVTRPPAPKDDSFGSGKMFDRIAFAYDLGNRWMSLGLDQFWRQTLLRECMRLQPQDHVLDLATGTADVALLVGNELRGLVANGTAEGASAAVYGVDPSREMLRHGVEKVRAAGLEGIVHLHQGDAQDLSNVESVMGAPKVSDGLSSVPSESIDKVSMSFGIRNVPDRAKALREIARVLKHNERSRACILEFSLPDGSSMLSKVAQFFIQHLIPFIGKIATLGKGGAEYQYLERSIVDFPAPKDFAAQMTRNGLAVHNITAFAYGSVQLYSAVVKM